MQTSGAAGRYNDGTVAPSSDQQSHSVTDNSGMGLYDSGLVPPGQLVYGLDLRAAGTFPVIDTATGHTSSFALPPQAAPLASPATTFTITCGSGSYGSGYLHDVQIKRPGSSKFVP